ncbi:MAG: pilin [bacterium]|nr:pilin [bacterium]
MNIKNIKKLVLFFSLVLMFVLPFVSSAQTHTTPGSAYTVPDQGGGRSTLADASSRGCFDTYDKDGKRLGSLFNYASCIIVDSIVPLLFAVALVAFLYGVVKFLMNADNQEEADKGKKFMIWGIVALAVMFSVWGLVGILRSTFGVTNSAIPKLPV